MPYDLKDMKQAAIGAFSAVLFFLAIRQGTPININPQIGLLVGATWLWLLYTYNGRIKKSEHLKHFIGNLILVVFLTHLLAVAFGLGTFNMISTFNYFGSASWIAVWMAMPVATLFDKRNIGNILDRYYSRK
jgi:hypothetical protein